eukprot:759030-Hanusia_phi.AAC.4
MWSQIEISASITLKLPGAAPGAAGRWYTLVHAGPRPVLRTDAAFRTASLSNRWKKLRCQGTRGHLDEAARLSDYGPGQTIHHPAARAMNSVRRRKNLNCHHSSSSSAMSEVSRMMFSTVTVNFGKTDSTNHLSVTPGVG